MAMWTAVSGFHHHREHEDPVVVDDIEEPGEDGELASRVSASSGPETQAKDRHGDQQGGEIGPASLLDPVGRVAVQAGDKQTGAGG